MKTQRIKYKCKYCGKQHFFSSKISDTHKELADKIDFELFKLCNEIIEEKGFEYLLKKLNLI